MKIGLAIRLARKNIDLSGKELAKRTGLSPSAITRIEKDQRGISLQTAQKIAKALGLRLSQLVFVAESFQHPENEIRRLQRELLLSVQPILNRAK